VATQEEAVDMDSNASYAGEVERKVGRDNDSLVRVAVSLQALEQLRSEVAPTMLRPITYCRTSLKARRRSVTAGA
jgi:hypothetical protein